jgi:hypothetical protein
LLGRRLSAIRESRIPGKQAEIDEIDDEKIDDRSEKIKI